MRLEVWKSELHFDSVAPCPSSLSQLRSTFNADPPLPEEHRDLLIYCTRRNAGDRQVVNEDEVLKAVSDLVSDQPHLQLYTFTGEESVQDTIQLFRRAKVVTGMHGAGLSHIAFSAPGTAVIELLFMNDPPMMFWHASGALSLQYFMVPLAQSWWLEKSITVSPQDVRDAVALAIGTPAGACPLGKILESQKSRP